MEKYINIWREICRILHDFISAPNFKKTLIWGIALYAIALFALLRGDIYYADDLQTSIWNLSWNHNSRYLGTFILNDLTTFGKGAVDSSPLLQIMAVILAVVSSLILVYLIRKKFDFIGIVASLPLGLSPHFLQNFSYKFESLFMCVALFFAIVPFLFKENRRFFCYVSVVSLILMFMCYQAANATYIVLSLYFAFSAYFLEKRSFKESIGFLGLCAISLIIATLLYKLTINPISAEVSDKMFATNSLFEGILANFISYITMIFNDLKNTPYIWLIALNCALFVVNAIFCENRRIYAFFKAILFLALGFCASYGLYLVLEKPLFHPRAYYGFNALIAIICIANVSQFAESRLDSAKMRQILRFLSIASIVVTAYFLISFANIYGNALKKQDEYLAFRAEMLLQDLSNKIPRGATITIDISRIGNAKVTQRFYEKYGFYLVIPQHARRDDFWFNMKLRHLNAPYNFGDAEICDMLKAQFGSEIIAENAHHKIQKAKLCYIVSVR